MRLDRVLALLVRGHSHPCAPSMDKQEDCQCNVHIQETARVQLTNCSDDEQQTVLAFDVIDEGTNKRSIAISISFSLSLSLSLSLSVNVCEIERARECMCVCVCVCVSVCVGNAHL